MINSILIKRDTVKLLRIPFSLFLMPVFLLALSTAPFINAQGAIWSFAIIHLLVYPASNGYNSYVDRDTGSIGGLENPPQPSRELFFITLLFDLLAIVLAGITVSYFFALCLVLYITASRAYSAPQVRLKKLSLPGFFTVVIFQGAFTYYMSLAGIVSEIPQIKISTIYILLACSFQIAGVYPLTQIYQHEADRQAGINTISMRLGIKGTFIFTLFMFLSCNLFYFLYFNAIEKTQMFLILQLFMLPIVSYFAWWFWKVTHNLQEANYKNTMRMNLIASVCTSTCFLIFIIL